jgi:hypothetical protein
MLKLCLQSVLASHAGFKQAGSRIQASNEKERFSQSLLLALIYHLSHLSLSIFHKEGE